MRLIGAVCAAALFTAIGAGPARGQTSSWLGGDPNNDNWSSFLNWSPPLAPTSLPDRVIVFGGTGTFAPNQDIADPFVLNSLQFADTSAAFTLGGQAIRFEADSGGTLPTLQQNSPTAQVINNDLSFLSNLSITGTGTLTLNGDLSTPTGSTARLIVTRNGATTLTGDSTLHALEARRGVLNLVGGSLTLTSTETGLNRPLGPTAKPWP